MVQELKEMFDKQRALQERLGEFPLNSTAKLQDFINTQSLALIDEVMEALRETPWKPWKKNQYMKQEEFKEELVDAWHFLINLTLASGMTHEELYARYCGKNKINHNRQDTGY